jgi:hypothetical protein
MDIIESGYGYGSTTLLERSQSAIANLVIYFFTFFRALIPVGEGVLGSAQLTVGDIAHFQPALVAADPASG